MSDNPLLDRLAALTGIAPDYADIWGNRHPVSEATRRGLLEAMGIQTRDDESLRRAVDERESAAWRRPLPTVLIVREHELPVRIPVCLPAGADGVSVGWTLHLETGEQREGRFLSDELEFLEERDLGGTIYRRWHLTIPGDLPLGYHRFSMDVPAGMQSSVLTLSLIVAPATCYRPVALTGEGRVWGPVVQLYAIRSERNWGIGDFTDLRHLLELAARLGAGIVGLNPLHALYPHNPDHISPYSPSSRLYLNILYLDVEAIPDYAESAEVRNLVGDPQFQARLRALRAVEKVDYKGVSALKLDCLERLYRHFREAHLNGGTERAKMFRRYQQAEGESLWRHALFEALQEWFYSQDSAMWGWPVWPLAYREPESEAVQTFAERNRDRVEFYQYLQWQAALQLADAGRRSLELGLGVGLYADLAVSIDRGGAEAWASHRVYALGASVGAPPDDFNLKGQDWGLPPLNPEALREYAYGPFITTLRASMRHAGALRIDHVMGLMRLFWVPPGGTPADGAYVAYPLDDLLGILALESQRNRCLVIGEDLGTVPDAVREALKPMGVLSYRLFYFEKDKGSFKSPAAFPQEAAVAASTHDLPTLTGYWRGGDLDLRHDLNLYPSEEVRQQQIVGRAQDRAELLIALEREGLLPAGMSVHPVAVPEMSPPLVRAIYGYLARTPSRVLLVQMEDVLGQADQVNLPGTTDQHPNWQRKLSLNLEAMAQDERLELLAAAIRQERGSAVSPPVAEVHGPGLAARIPRATYRLQLNRDFTFSQAAELVPYLAELGISHCYLSPFLKARPGSTHGYDIIDHNALNPEIGSDEDFQRFVAALREHGMGQIMDVVPNHMGIMGADNAWWLDVLENGPASVYGDYFDIDWRSPGEFGYGKVLVPVLGDHYGAVLERGELVLRFDSSLGEFSVMYYQHRFPLDPATYPAILERGLGRIVARLGEGNPILLEFQSLITAFGHLPGRLEREAGKIAERERDKEIHKRHLASLWERAPDIAWLIGEILADINEGAGESRRYDALHEFLDNQAYRLAYWRVASDEINYRRFFDINDLAALRMEKLEVFEATHGLVLDMVAKRQVDGLRIDHPDGLFDPTQYFARLQSHVAGRFAGRSEGDSERAVYVVVEKILAPYEKLPEQWLVHGTTGYDFLNQLNGLFVDSEAAERMEKVYSGFVAERMDFDDILYRSKKLIMRSALASELQVLAAQLARIARADRHTLDITGNNLRAALMEIVACFPVYRSYITGDQVSAEDRRYVEWAVSVARKRSQVADVSVFNFVSDVLLTAIAEGQPAEYREAVVSLAMKFQQLSSPVMAKGMEDTSFYIFNRLASINEVGGDPRRFGVSVTAFHRLNQDRCRSWPYAMLSTSTHDSKRSEDVRARLNVLSEIPDEWRRNLARWQRINRAKKLEVDGEQAPSRNDEYLLYQTLLGIFPLEEPGSEALDDVRQRVAAYMVKAVREAKVRSSWVNPDPAYEDAVTHFVDELLDPAKGSRFLAEFRPWQARIARCGLYNSLSQVLLKLTAPGVPDIYRGCELWDFSLVDPDNRRPVDYGLRHSLLASLAKPPEGESPMQRALDLLNKPEDGRIKLHIIRETLALRREEEALFRDGEYLPLKCEGLQADHLCAYARQLGERVVLVVAPRLFWALTAEGDKLPTGSDLWRETWIEVPEGLDVPWINRLSGEQVTAGLRENGRYLGAADLLGHFPWALLTSAR